MDVDQPILREGKFEPGDLINLWPRDQGNKYREKVGKFKRWGMVLCKLEKNKMGYTKYLVWEFNNPGPYNPRETYGFHEKI